MDENLLYKFYEWNIYRKLDKDKMPKHVAIIMDGNRRYSRIQGNIDVIKGHEMGVDTLERVLDWTIELGIKIVTVYAFSTENWSRPESEVKTLMFLFRKYIKICYTKAMKNNTRVRVIGDKTGLAEDLQESIRTLETDTAKNTGLQFQIAINYGSRDEMLRGMRQMMQDYKEGKITLEEVDEAHFSDYLDTAGIPDPDLMIRTSGEQRLSNYLMWQHAYSEFYFTDTPWPEFNKAELVKAIEAYTSRDRRYGKVKA